MTSMRPRRLQPPDLSLKEWQGLYRLLYHLYTSEEHQAIVRKIGAYLAHADPSHSPPEKIPHL